MVQQVYDWEDFSKLFKYLLNDLFQNLYSKALWNMTQTDVLSTDVLSPRTFSPHGHFVRRTFCPPDVLSPRTFCPTDVLSLWMFCPRGCFVPMGVLSTDVLSPDILSGHLCIRAYNSDAVESLQSHSILTMSHWSSGLPVCFPSQETQVQIPKGVLVWNRDSLVSVVSLHWWPRRDWSSLQPRLCRASSQNCH